MAHTNIFLNSIEISALPGVSINKMNYHARAKRNVVRKDVAKADGPKVVSAQYGNKTIVMGGVISATSKALFEQYRDTFFMYLDPLEVTLSVIQGGITRNYQCTVDDISWTEDPMGGFGEFIVSLISAPFSTASAYATARNITGITVGNTTNGIGPLLGSYKTAPKLTVTITTVVGGTNKYIKITNPSTSKYIQVNGSFANSDVLVIEPMSSTPVLLNGSAIDFAGVFLEFSPGDATIKYEDNFTSRNVALKVEYKRRDF